MFEKIKSFLFENRTTRQTVAKNTLWLAISNVGGRFLRAGIIIYSARVLGAGEWGIFSYAITLVGFLTAVIDCGINPILTREASKTSDEAERSRIISTAFFIKLALVALGILFIIFLAPYLSTLEGAQAILPIVVFVFIFDSLREFGFSLTRAIERMEWETGLNLLTNAAIVAFGFIFLMRAPNVASFTTAYAAGTGVGLLATAWALRRYGREIFSNFSRRLVGPILRSAWPFSISGLLAVLLTNTDILMIGWFRSAAEVGHYSAALRIVQLLYILPSIFTLSILPTLSRLAHENRERFRNVLEQTLIFALMIAVPMGLGGALLGEEIIRFVFGTDYLPAVSSFQVLMFTLIFDFTAVIIASAVFTFDKQKNLIIYAAIGGSLNVVLDLLLIPRFGIVGSAWATLIAQCVSNYYLWIVLNRINPFRVMPHLGRIAIAAPCMFLVAVAGTASGLHVVLTIGISMLAYFGALIFLKEPTLHELRLIVRNHEA